MCESECECVRVCVVCVGCTGENDGASGLYESMAKSSALSAFRS